MTIITTIINWFFKNPIMIAVIILSLSTAWFHWQAKHHKEAAQEAILRANGAEEALRRAKAREKALEALTAAQREDNANVESHIIERTYFGNH